MMIAHISHPDSGRDERAKPKQVDVASPHRYLRREAVKNQQQSGFTLVEMMVALVAGAIVVTSVYYIGAVTTRQFVEQDEVSRLQQGLRLAANRLKRDVERAGFLATPNLIKTRAECDPTGPNFANSIQNFAAIEMSNGSPSDDAASAGSSTALPQAERQLHATDLDAVVLTGNFITVDEQVATLVPPNRFMFRQDLQGFRRNFGAQGSASDAAFTNVYRARAGGVAGRYVRVVTETGKQMFLEITAAVVDNDAEEVYIEVANDLPLSGPCASAFYYITPITAIKYHVINDPPGSDRLVQSLHGNHAALVRVEVQLVPGDLFNRNYEIPQTAQVVLENAVMFDVDFVRDARDTGATSPDFALIDDSNANMSPNALDKTGAHRLRSAIIRMASRGPLEDARQPWPYSGNRSDVQADNEPLWRYDADTDQLGTVRVREMRVEFPLPNIANADPDIRGAS